MHRLSRTIGGTSDRGGVRARLARSLSVVLIVSLVTSLAPIQLAVAAREGETAIAWSDSDGDGTPELLGIDWDGDGAVDEWWYDDNDDGVIDRTEVDNTGGDTTRSPRGRPGMRVHVTPLAEGGAQVAADWNADGSYDEIWWDLDGDTDVDTTDTYETESKILDNTKATRFRGVFVGVKNGLDHPEDDVEDLTGALEGYPASWSATDMAKLTGAAATPAAIQAAIDAAKASSKPGDEFIFYFSGHGGGWNRDKGRMGGGFVDGDGDESANQVPESDFGRFDGSTVATPSAGKFRNRPVDADGDGATDTYITKDSAGNVTVWRPNDNPPPNWIKAGEDMDGDDDVDGDDGGVDMNGDGDKDDMVGIDDTILVAGRVQVSDDQLATWLSGFPESVTIVVILDSCHSGSFTNDLQRLTDKDGKPLRPGHMEVVTAAAWDEVAYEEPISNGVLTQAIIDALTPLPPSTTGGHTTSVADFVGDRDDRTTTAELADWAGPAAVTYLNQNADGDMSRNEDGTTCQIAYGPDTTLTDEAPGDPPPPPVEAWVEHISEDDDGDGLIDEDKQPTVQSFFDVYCDPEFDSRGTPRLLSWFSGDQAFDISGMAPAIRVRSEIPIALGTAADPGPTFRLGIRQTPRHYEPDPVTGGGPAAYGSPVFDIAMGPVQQVPGLDKIDPAVEPALSNLSIPWPAPPDLRISIKPLPGVPAEVCIPAVWEPTTKLWAPLPDRIIDPLRGVVEFHPPHFSKFALLFPGPTPPPSDTSIAALRRLMAQSTPCTVTAMWAPPTDPDLSLVRVLRSIVRYPGSPVDRDYEVAYEGKNVWFSEALPPGTYYYAAFAQDLDGNWSEPTTFMATIPEPVVNRPPIAEEDTATVTQDATLTVSAPGVLRNDSDPDGDQLYAELTMPPEHGNLVLGRDGSYSYRAAPGFSGTDRFHYVASDLTTESAPATVTITVTESIKTATTLRRTSKGTTLTYPTRYNFRGRLTADGVPVQGASVALESSTNGTDFEPTGLSVVTDEDGEFSVRIRPTGRVWYRAVYAGSTTLLGSQSTSARVLVKARLSMPSGASTVKRNKAATYGGTLEPAHKNKAKAIRIYRYRSVGRNKWKRYGAYVTVAVKTVDGSTTWSKALKFPTRGKWRIRAYHADSLHAANYSAYKNITVK